MGTGEDGQHLVKTVSNSGEWGYVISALWECLNCQESVIDKTKDSLYTTTDTQSVTLQTTGTDPVNNKIEVTAKNVYLQSDGQDLTFSTNSNNYIFPDNIGNEGQVLAISSINGSDYTLEWKDRNDSCYKCIQDPQNPSFYDFSTVNVHDIILDPIFAIKLNGNQTEIVNSLSGPNNSYILPKLLSSIDDDNILTLEDSTTNNTSDWGIYGFETIPFDINDPPPAGTNASVTITSVAGSVTVTNVGTNIRDIILTPGTGLVISNLSKVMLSLESASANQDNIFLIGYINNNEIDVKILSIDGTNLPSTVTFNYLIITPGNTP
jgi:hypothetical protein